VLIVGGHTVDDKEPKYGMSVTGVVKPGAQVTNAGAKVGDVLVLTKPIGTGIITTAGKQQRVDKGILDNAVSVMGTLNRAASEAMIKVGVNACTDVTGFGLLGHLKGMVEGSNVGARIEFSSVPILDGVWGLLKDNIAPGGTHRNLESVDDIIKWQPGVDEMVKLLLADAQTSGGLLISVASDKKDRLLGELEAAGVGIRAVIGEIVESDSLGDGKLIEVLP
jgi:selenide,water dikinase